MYNNYRVVDIPKIKPNCFPVNRSVAFMCFTMLSRLIDSSSLHGTLVRLYNFQGIFSSF